MTEHMQLLEDMPSRRLTPDEVARTQFHRVRFGGVSEEEVTRFLGQVHVELVHLLEERAELSDEVERLARLPHPAPAEQDVGQQAARILAATQRQREHTLAQTQQHVQHMIGDAERQRRRLLDDAQRKIQELTRVTLEEATREAGDIKARAPIDAQARVAQLEALGDVLAQHLGGVVSIVSGVLTELQNRLAAAPAEASAAAGGNGHAPAHAAV